VFYTRKHLSYWLPVLVWMAVIFVASSDAASFSHSSRLIAPIVRWLVPGISESALHDVVVLVRKAAHVSEYAILAFLIWRWDRAVSKPKPAGWSWPSAWRTVLWVMAYAASDEFHQLFVPSREASVLDVLIDTSGAVFALLLIWVIGRWRRRW
jgi:VanZ family protein